MISKDEAMLDRIPKNDFGVNLMKKTINCSLENINNEIKRIEKYRSIPIVTILALFIFSILAINFFIKEQDEQITKNQDATYTAKVQALAENFALHDIQKIQQNQNFDQMLRDMVYNQTYSKKNNNKIQSFNSENKAFDRKKRIDQLIRSLTFGDKISRIVYTIRIQHDYIGYVYDLNESTIRLIGKQDDTFASDSNYLSVGDLDRKLYFYNKNDYLQGYLSEIEKIGNKKIINDIANSTKPIFVLLLFFVFLAVFASVVIAFYFILKPIKKIKKEGESISLGVNDMLHYLQHEIRTSSSISLIHFQIINKNLEKLADNDGSKARVKSALHKMYAVELFKTKAEEYDRTGERFDQGIKSLLKNEDFYKYFYNKTIKSDLENDLDYYVKTVEYPLQITNITASKNELSSILFRLLSNAFKHVQTLEHEAISISIGTKEENNQNTVVSIKNLITYQEGLVDRFNNFLLDDKTNLSKINQEAKKIGMKIIPLVYSGANEKCYIEINLVVEG